MPPRLMLTLLGSLSEPEARASMIWIIGEYAERIYIADDHHESFLDNFHDENSQVQLQLLTAIVKLFLKRPTDTQELVQLELVSLTTQDSENPDLRDRRFIFWRLLSTDPVSAKDVLLAEKLLIAEETDLLEELICHIVSLASVYHKPPIAFVEGKVELNRMLSARAAGDTDSDHEVAGATIIPEPGSIIGDLFEMDIGGAAVVPRGHGGAPAPDLLGGGLDQLLIGGTPEPAIAGTNSLIGDIFGMGGTGYVPSKQV